MRSKICSQFSIFNRELGRLQIGTHFAPRNVNCSQRTAPKVLRILGGARWETITARIAALRECFPLFNFEFQFSAERWADYRSWGHGCCITVPRNSAVAQHRVQKPQTQSTLYAADARRNVQYCLRGRHAIRNTCFAVTNGDEPRFKSNTLRKPFLSKTGAHDLAAGTLQIEYVPQAFLKQDRRVRLSNRNASNRIRSANRS